MLISGDIVTPRLVLRLIGGRGIASCLAGDLAQASHGIDAVIPAELLDQPAVLQYSQKCLRADGLYGPWSARAIILRRERRMVGHVRFHGRPDPDKPHPWAPGAVELGYLIFAGDRGRGYATEAVTAVLDWATRTAGVSRFVASVSPGNAPSLRLVARLGFVAIGEEIDEIDGIEQVFLRG